MKNIVGCLLLLTATSVAYGQTLEQRVTRELPRLVETYKALHAAPELSYMEAKTSTFVANELRSLGYTVTEHIGKYSDPKLNGYGVVGIMKNGPGKTLLIRTDMDGLPVLEKTELPYASSVRATSDTGEEVPVMHACGHDIHMTSFLGTAKLLASMKDRWHGTLMMVAQPAEERGAGAKAMLADDLYTRFPRPDYALALHDNATLPAGKVGVIEGFALASVDSVDITVRGIGGHGAYPHTTKDPIVIASEIVVALQTIVSREKSPLEPAVVTVGSFQGGTKHNIIPDEVKLKLTVRTYKAEVRSMILASIERISRGIAIAAGVPDDRLPIVSVQGNEMTPATYNDPAMTKRVRATIAAAIGDGNVVTVDPVMGGEDFGRFSLDNSIPSSIFWLGAVEPAKVASGQPLPSLHSPLFAPLPEPTLRTGITATTAAALDLLK
jgi:hippurate hydrolase